MKFPKKIQHAPKESFKSDPEYIRWLHGWRCIVNGCTTPWPVHSHHVKTKGAGGSDRDCVPLCPNHHTGKNGIHILGRHTWCAQYMVDMEGTVRVLNQLYNDGKKGPMEHRLPPHIKVVKSV